MIYPRHKLVCLSVISIFLPQERFYFGDHVLPCFETGVPLLKQRLQLLPDANNVSYGRPPMVSLDRPVHASSNKVQLFAPTLFMGRDASTKCHGSEREDFLFSSFLFGEFGAPFVVQFFFARLIRHESCR